MPALEDPPKRAVLVPNRRSSVPTLTPNEQTKSKMGTAFDKAVNGPRKSQTQDRWQDKYYDNVPGSSGDAMDDSEVITEIITEDDFEMLDLKMDEALKEDLNKKGVPRDI